MWLAGEGYQFDAPIRPTEYVDAYGDLCQRFEIAPGPMRIRWSAIVETEDAIAVEPNALATPVGQLPDEALQFLLQCRECPSDKMAAQAQQIAGGFTPGYAQVEAIRAWIHQNIAYQYGVSSATTDAVDTLNSKAGVRRDFSHIGISLCRALRIPARMGVGYLYQLDPMDLHAWFEAYSAAGGTPSMERRTSRAVGASSWPMGAMLRMWPLSQLLWLGAIGQWPAFVLTPLLKPKGQAARHRRCNGSKAAG